MMKNQLNNFCGYGLVVAAGRGKRFYAPLEKIVRPKQYQLLQGQEVLFHAMTALLEQDFIKKLLVVIHPNDKLFYHQLITDLCLKNPLYQEKLLPPVFGAENRQASVFKGLLALEKLFLTEAITVDESKIVFVHDGARPLLFAKNEVRQLCQKLYSAVVNGYGGAVPTLTIWDAIKWLHVQKNKDKVISADILIGANRQIHRMQTPQVFLFNKILFAHKNHAGKNYSDDVGLWLVQYGGDLSNKNSTVMDLSQQILAVNGHQDNYKITTQQDMIKYNFFHYRSLTTLGVDVHSFDQKASEQGKICLGGVNIPHTHQLIGHSDADCVLHALTDALLGLIAAGDIGEHFSPADERWRNADSRIFLQHAWNLCIAKSVILNHIDITILAETPKISVYRDAIRQSIAKLLGLPLHFVAVKATTTETKGFIGRKEGIVALVQVSASLPNR